jgi:hypothetical protein
LKNERLYKIYREGEVSWRAAKNEFTIYIFYLQFYLAYKKLHGNESKNCDLHLINKNSPFLIPFIQKIKHILKNNLFGAVNIIQK